MVGAANSGESATDAGEVYVFNLQTTSELTDLSVLQADSVDPVELGTNLTYTFTVPNAGPGSASGVTLTDTLPPGVAFLSSSPAGACSDLGGGTIECTVGSLGVDSQTVVSIVVTVPGTAGTLSNPVTVSGGEPDLNTSNNTATEDTEVVL